MSDEQETIEPTTTPIVPSPIPLVSKTTGDKIEFVVTVKETGVTANILATDPEDAWDHFCQTNKITGAGLTKTVTETK